MSSNEVIISGHTEQSVKRHTASAMGKYLGGRITVSGHFWYCDNTNTVTG